MWIINSGFAIHTHRFIWRGPNFFRPKRALRTLFTYFTVPFLRATNPSTCSKFLCVRATVARLYRAAPRPGFLRATVPEFLHTPSRHLRPVHRPATVPHAPFHRR